MDADLLPIATKLQDAAKYPVLGGKYVFCATTDKDITNRLINVSLLDRGRESTFSQVIGNHYLSAFPIQDYSNKTAGVMVMVIDISSQQAILTKIEEEGMAKLSSLRWLLVVGILILVLLLGCLITWFVTRIIVLPVNKTVMMLQELSKGHLDMRLKMDRNDEIGQMANSLDSFADNLQNEVVGSLQKLANGDLTFEARPKDDRDLIGTALKKTGDALNNLVAEIRAATGQIADSSQALSQGATESAASLEQISSSMTELAAQTSTNAENAGQANQLAGQARDSAEKGNAQMQNMVGAMAEINDAGQSISQIIKVIDEIAFQTNLLALNAAVEAARAGKHGKGFAVVAEEVRNLAARSAKAARETAELIESSVQKSSTGTEIANQTADSLAEIVNSVNMATVLVGEISASSNEQAEGISQVTQGLNQIDQVTQANTASAEEGAAAEELSSQAVHLKGLMATFTIKESSRHRS